MTLEAFETLGLTVRKGPGGTTSGTFRYRWPEPMLFRFDAAGLNPDGGLVLLEEETASISSLHVYGHLGRLLIMGVLGDAPAEIAWVVDPKRLSDLQRITRPWYRLASEFARIPMPRPHYLSPSGRLLLTGE